MPEEAPIPLNQGGVAPTDPLVWSMESAPKRLGIGKTKFSQLVAEGKIQTIRVGTRRLVPDSSLRHYVIEQLGGAS